MDRVRDILTDQVPPFARATALATAITFEPLWFPSDLPAGAGQVGSLEEGLAWSRGEARGILSRRLTELGLLAAQQQQQQEQQEQQEQKQERQQKQQPSVTVKVAV